MENSAVRYPLSQFQATTADYTRPTTSDLIRQLEGQLGDDYEVVIRRRKPQTQPPIKLTDPWGFNQQHVTSDNKQYDPCALCSGNPKNNPHASGICHCTLPSMYGPYRITF